MLLPVRPGPEELGGRRPELCWLPRRGVASFSSPLVTCQLASPRVINSHYSSAGVMFPTYCFCSWRSRRSLRWNLRPHPGSLHTYAGVL